MEPQSLRHRPAERRLRGRAETRLARAAAAGSPAAFATIFREHAPELHRYCRSILGNEHDATDAVQSTMLRALEALPGERRTIALRPWLFRVAHNEAIDLLRARRPHVELDEACDVSDRVGSGAIEDRERLRALQADLARLTERQRGALLLRELVGLSFAEIADTFGIAESAAKQSVYEARRALTTLAQGRAMGCDAIARALSDGDRRTLRGRAVRAHLDECAGCRAFADGLRRRPADLGALAPPVAAGSLLLPALGAAGGASVAGGGAAAGGGFLPSLSALLGLVPAGGKVAATVLAVGAVAGGGTAVVALSDGPPRAAADTPAVVPAGTSAARTTDVTRITATRASGPSTTGAGPAPAARAGAGGSAPARPAAPPPARGRRDAAPGRPDAPRAGAPATRGGQPGDVPPPQAGHGRADDARGDRTHDPSAPAAQHRGDREDRGRRDHAAAAQDHGTPPARPHRPAAPTPHADGAAAPGRDQAAARPGGGAAGRDPGSAAAPVAPQAAGRAPADPGPAAARPDRSAGGGSAGGGSANGGSAGGSSADDADGASARPAAPGGRATDAGQAPGRD